MLATPLPSDPRPPMPTSDAAMPGGPTGGPTGSAQAVRTVAFGDDAFHAALADMAERWRQEQGARVAFLGPPSLAHQDALGTLARLTTGRVHQFDVPMLLAERRRQTQSSLRKAFDAGADEDALLFFLHADAAFTWQHDDDTSAHGAQIPTVDEYFFQRVANYPGVVVVHLSAARLDEARPTTTFDLAVRFPTPSAPARPRDAKPEA